MRGGERVQTVSQDIQEMSITSLKSTLNKLSNAYETMVEKGSNTTLVTKRRDAVKVGLASLEGVWQGQEFSYDNEKILTSIEVLQSLIPSIEKQIMKAKKGSPQKTLNERRLTALKLAIQSLNDRLG